MFQIRKEQKRVPAIDFSLRLDAYHTNDNCLHCKRGVLESYLYTNSLGKEQIDLGDPYYDAKHVSQLKQQQASQKKSKSRQKDE